MLAVLMLKRGSGMALVMKNVIDCKILAVVLQRFFYVYNPLVVRASEKKVGILSRLNERAVH